MTEPTAVRSDAWQERFRVPRTIWVQIARRRPERGLICSSRTGTYQLHRWNVETGELGQLTDEPTGRWSGRLSPDGEHVVWLADEAGDEIGHYVAAPWVGGEPVNITPDLPPYNSFFAVFDPDASVLALSIIARDGPSIVILDWGESGPIGKASIVDPGPGFVTSVAIDVNHNGRRIAYATTADRGLATLVRLVDVASGEVRAEIDHGSAAVNGVAFDPSGSGRLLAWTTRSGSLRPLLVEVDGTIQDYDLTDVRGDLMPVDWTPDGASVLLLNSDRATHRLYLLDLASRRARALDHPTGAISDDGTLVAPDGSIVVTREDGTAPPEVIALDPATGRVIRTLIPAPDAPSSRPWRSVDVPSTDGAMVQGWLATPAGAGPFPTILDVHGGPQAQETDRFIPALHAWLDHGYAVLTLNYRGSTGFGREYEQAIWGRPGRCELDDMVAARDHLVGEGIARPDAIVPHGGSYGGYLTLLALGRRPDLWAAGVAQVAIGDWRLMYEDGAALRDYLRALFDGTPDERPDLYAEASPITYVGDLRTPLLIIQGRNDARCPVRQINAYIDAARAAGKRVEVDWYDAGHSHGGAEQRIAWAGRSIEFVNGVLGG